MTIYEQIETLSREEIKAITNDVTFSAALASHLRKISKIQADLEAELKKYKEVAKFQMKSGKLEGNKTVTIENRPSPTFDKEAFIDEYGEDEYNRFMVKKDRLYVFFN